MNIDYVFQVESIVKPGQTVSARDFRTQCGGKGFNQSIAAARAGSKVFHAGKVGIDGAALVDKLRENGVDTSNISPAECFNGHAMIQVDSSGENCIIIYGGSNLRVTEAEMDRALKGFGPGDWLMLQNEINGVPLLIKKGRERGLKISVNVAPADKGAVEFPLEEADVINVNEAEGYGLTGLSEPRQIIKQLMHRCQNSLILLTLGADGLLWGERGEIHVLGAYDSKKIDTTGAGDTFVGYFVASVEQGMSYERAADFALRAAAICISRRGAADSIPFKAEVESLSNR